MSNPPEYRRRLDDEESAPLFKDGGRTSLELETASTTYPPVLGQTSTSINEERPTVNYTFRSRKPDQGQKHSAIGVVGRTKAETIEIVQRGFAVLARYPPEKIEFLSLMQLKGDVLVDDPWGLVMDEAWPTFQNSPPSHLVVQIQDEPGDAEQRAAQEEKEAAYICVSIFVVILIFFSFVLGVVYFKR